MYFYILTDPLWLDSRVFSAVLAAGWHFFNDPSGFPDPAHYLTLLPVLVADLASQPNESCPAHL